MTDNKNRLSEAQKQIQIVTEKIEDEALVENLKEAETILETVEDGLGEP